MADHPPPRIVAGERAPPRPPRQPTSRSAAADLDTRAAIAPLAPPPMSMRWLLVHLVEELARHAGYAYILREQLDGTVGR